ncbi:MAG: hypothetical protein LBP73_05920 [Clostridiales Family XIII bacterium]|jgi:hypothetical protein|nr:hypothetical protein [Clostridiales Family XIII bacterium]
MQGKIGRNDFGRAEENEYAEKSCGFPFLRYNVHRQRSVIAMNDMIFDYIGASQTLKVPESVLCRLEDEARREFPRDSMLMELHVLRAINAYAADNKKAANI